MGIPNTYNVYTLCMHCPSLYSVYGRDADSVMGLMKVAYATHANSIGYMYWDTDRVMSLTAGRIM